MENLFNYNWELCKFERIFEKVKSYSLSREVETNELTGMKYIHYGDIHTKKADKVSENSNIPNIIKKNFALLEIGDLILTDASEDYKGIATPAVIRENTSFDIVAGLHTIALRPKNIDPMFLYYLIKAPTFRKYGYKVGTGMKVFGISSSKVLDFTTYIPKNDETKLVSSFLEKIDYALDLHQRKLDQLKELKKAYLQVMFPAKDERVPKLRFADFEGEWEQCKLEDLANKYNNLRIPITASKRIYGNTPYYGANGIQDFVEGYTHDGEFILVAEDGASNLKDYPVQYVNGKVWVNNHAHVLQAKRSKADNKFLMNAIKSINIEPFLVGGGRSKLNSEVMMNLEINTPSKDEQLKISTLCKQLDDITALYQNKLNQLKNLKKSYLQNMFI